MTLISDDFLDTSAKVPTLLGGRSRVTGEIKFPCPRGVSAQEYEPIALKTEGTLSVSYTHLRAHETEADLVCRLLLEKKKEI